MTSILRTARAGSPARAWGMFVDGGWLDVRDDPKALTLKGRLIKDQAKAASGDERLRLFREAGEAYEESSRVEPGSYPLINAATLALMGRDAEKSKSLAKDVITMLDDNPLEAETPYWLAATRSEAHLLLGEEAEAQAALKDAIHKAPKAWEDHAATIGQFGMLAEKLGADAGWLEAHRPPASLHFQGAMGVAHDDAKLRAEIDAWLEAKNIGFGYGALAAGADIIIAEALLARGAELHIVLPCAREKFRAQSVEPFGHDWAERFDHLIANADEVEHARVAADVIAKAVTIGEEICLGLARRNALVLQSKAHLLRVTGDIPRNRPSNNSWQQSGGTIKKIAANVMPESALQQILDGVDVDRDAKITYAFLAIRHGKEGLDHRPKSGVRCINREPGFSFLEFHNLNDALEYSAELRLVPEYTHLPMAIDYVLSGATAHHSYPLFRIGQYAEVAHEGQLVATRRAAFAILAGNAQIRVEQLGDMRAAHGVFPYYAIISSS